MDYLFLSIIISSLGTISMMIIYIYLYALYRERFMGLWSLSWLILLSRYLFFDANFQDWQQSNWCLLTYELFIYLNSLTFLLANHSFINKPLNKGWLYIAITTFTLNVVLNTILSSFIYKLLLPLFFGCSALIWVGLLFIRHLKLKGIGRFI
ncbi:MAG: sasA 14, partial [Massilibacillus sp.]|nr:sasA 14 [Massilibacillus sp.]